MKNSFRFILKVFPFLRYLRFSTFDHVEKRLNKKAEFNFKILDAKNLSVLEMLTFCPDFLVMQKNSFIGKLSLISKFQTSQAGYQVNKMHILPNISRSKGNQTIKFSELIKCNMRNNFQKKLCQKCWEKLVPDSFIKNRNWADLQKQVQKQSSYHIFCIIFEEKYFSPYVLLHNMCILIICCPVCDVKNLKLTFLSNRFSTKPKSQVKSINISRTKRAFNMK